MQEVWQSGTAASLSVVDIAHILQANYAFISGIVSHSAVYRQTNRIMLIALHCVITVISSCVVLLIIFLDNW